MRHAGEVAAAGELMFVERGQACMNRAAAIWARHVGVRAGDPLARAAQ
jgi:hypothetical protein